ncbi:MAG: regulatory protein [Rhodospirillaceae bacterium]|nr:MAG: regulatory protein [Rhodospirillaceae bacterium]
MPEKGEQAQVPEASPACSDTAWLEQVALRYLARFEAPRERVRRLLLARLGRVGGTAAGLAAVEVVLTRLVARRLIDDDRFAQMRARGLNRKGRSLRAIRAILQDGGVATSTAAAALAMLVEEGSVSDLRAAAVYCRRRQFGPFRSPAQRQTLRLRDVAALTRVGFEASIACLVIDAATAEEVEAWALDPTAG